MKNSNSEPRVTPDYYMREALAEADKALENGEVPIGAVIVCDEKIIGRGYNSPIGSMDPSSHAEIVALREACRSRRNYRIPGCDLYVTLEPCAMCLGAAVQARISRIYFGASDPKSGAVFSVMRFPFEKLNHKIEFKGGILDEESAIILKTFFKKRR
jgi:tRNA(adenine34) deaminase